MKTTYTILIDDCDGTEEPAWCLRVEITNDDGLYGGFDDIIGYQSEMDLDTVIATVHASYGDVEIVS
jgi:hypothetical protein